MQALIGVLDHEFYMANRRGKHRQNGSIELGMTYHIHQVSEPDRPVRGDNLWGGRLDLLVQQLK